MRFACLSVLQDITKHDCDTAGSVRFAERVLSRQIHQHPLIRSTQALWPCNNLEDGQVGLSTMSDSGSDDLLDITAWQKPRASKGKADAPLDKEETYQEQEEDGVEVRITVPAGFVREDYEDQSDPATYVRRVLGAGQTGGRDVYRTLFEDGHTQMVRLLPKSLYLGFMLPLFLIHYPPNLLQPRLFFSHIFTHFDLCHSSSLQLFHVYSSSHTTLITLKTFLLLHTLRKHCNIAPRPHSEPCLWLCGSELLVATLPLFVPSRDFPSSQIFVILLTSILLTFHLTDQSQRLE